MKYFNCYGLMLRSFDKNGNETVFAYETDDIFETRLKSIASPAGKVFEITMDEENRITGILLPDGTDLSYEYNANGNLVLVYKCGHEKLNNL